MPLSADRDQIAKHVAALFANADNGSYISLRGFEDSPDKFHHDRILFYLGAMAAAQCLENGAGLDRIMAELLSTDP